MATGSQATRKAERDKAGYLTGQRQSMPRCDSCTHSEAPPATQRQTAYDKVCDRHRTGVKTHGVCVFWQPREERAVVALAQLQFNSAGAWRGSLNFDAGNVPNEFWDAADHLARLSGSNVTMRAVACEQGQSGGTRPTNSVLMHWSREKGWVKA